MNEKIKSNSKGNSITNVLIGLSLGIVGTLALSSDTRNKVKSVVKNKSKEITDKCKFKSSLKFNNKDTSENYIEIKPTYKENKEDLE